MVPLPWSWKRLHYKVVSSAEEHKGAPKIKLEGKKGIIVKGGEWFMHTTCPSPGHGHKIKLENMSLKSYSPKRKLKEAKDRCIFYSLNS